MPDPQGIPAANNSPDVSEQIGDSQMDDGSKVDMAYPDLDAPNLGKNKSFDPNQIPSEDLIEQ